MKSILQYALVCLLATSLAISTAPVLAASPTPETVAAHLALEDRAADQALEQMARAAVAQFGEQDAPAALSLQLATLAALCQGVDEAALARTSATGEEKSIRLQAATLRLIQVKHPLCKRLAARSA